MDREVLIKADNVSKKFCKDLKKSLKYGFQDLGAMIFGGQKNHDLRKDEFWAVKDVSFEVRRGECLGLIGHNGAGKSTLLKMLNGLINPDVGSITMKGKVGALIELGAGFNPILTGRENIYNSAAVYGFTKEETDAKLEDIIEFSELRDFMDMPVQNYSSGMKVRLGFAVAVFMDPDILILDEVLAVGDAGFRIKSFNKMKEVMKKAAVILVSHSMPQVARTCDTVLYMRHGQTIYRGKNVNEGIGGYFDEFKSEEGKIEFDTGAEIHNISINSEMIKADSDVKLVQYGKELTIEFDVEIKDKMVKQYHLHLQFIDKDLKLVAMHFSDILNEPFINNGNGRIKVTFPELQLADGEYGISYFLADSDSEEGLSSYRFLCIYRNYTKFKVTGLNATIYSPFHLKALLSQNNLPIRNKS